MNTPSKDDFLVKHLMALRDYCLDRGDCNNCLCNKQVKYRAYWEPEYACILNYPKELAFYKDEDGMEIRHWGMK